MKRVIFIFLLFFSTNSVLKSQNIKVFYENKPQGYVVYAANSEFCPVSISLDLEISNLLFSEGKKKVFVIPPTNEKFKIGELSVIKTTAEHKFIYNYIYALGDVTLSNYDKSFEYDLPFQKGKSYNVYQGYNGNFSHQNENSIDFTMPEGTEILAARDGIIIEVVVNNTKSCPTKDCAKYNNYITIMHPDGTFANYSHIKYNGSQYKRGDKVKKGDLIAYSRNVGYSSGPHLHFVCYLAGFEKWRSVETVFKIDRGDRAVPLKEKTNYIREY
jgi:murein DD-endopeptidase MepM/ murein hydrolase activator NlpD